jgi:hypothetical protein
LQHDVGHDGRLVGSCHHLFEHLVQERANFAMELPRFRGQLRT